MVPATGLEPVRRFPPPCFSDLLSKMTTLNHSNTMDVMPMYAKRYGKHSQTTWKAKLVLRFYHCRRQAPLQEHGHTGQKTSGRDLPHLGKGIAARREVECRTRPGKSSQPLWQTLWPRLAQACRARLSAYGANAGWTSKRSRTNRQAIPATNRRSASSLISSR